MKAITKVMKEKTDCTPSDFFYSVVFTFSNRKSWILMTYDAMNNILKVSST